MAAHPVLSSCRSTARSPRGSTASSDQRGDAVLRVHLIDLLRARLDAGVQRSALAFYLWIGVFNMMIIAQFWSFANDLYNSERGKRLFPIVGVGAVGRGIGARARHVVFTRHRALSADADRGGRSAGPAGAHEPHSSPRTAAADREQRRRRRRSRSAGRRLQAGAQQRYLLLIALLVLVFNLVNTNGENYILTALISHGGERASPQAPLAGWTGALHRQLHGGDVDHIGEHRRSRLVISSSWCRESSSTSASAARCSSCR